MARRRNLTELQLAAVKRAARAVVDEELGRGSGWIRSITAGDRVTLASLEVRGILERRPWRGDGISRDSAFEYRLAPAIRGAYARKIQTERR